MTRLTDPPSGYTEELRTRRRTTNLQAQSNIYVSRYTSSAPDRQPGHGPADGEALKNEKCGMRNESARSVEDAVLRDAE